MAYREDNNNYHTYNVTQYTKESYMYLAPFPYNVYTCTCKCRMQYTRDSYMYLAPFPYNVYIECSTPGIPYMAQFLYS